MEILLVFLLLTSKLSNLFPSQMGSQGVAYSLKTLSFTVTITGNILTYLFFFSFVIIYYLY